MTHTKINTYNEYPLLYSPKAKSLSLFTQKEKKQESYRYTTE